MTDIFKCIVTTIIIMWATALLIATSPIWIGPYLGYKLGARLAEFYKENTK